jgi:hypothetical protein
MSHTPIIPPNVKLLHHHATSVWPWVAVGALLLITIVLTIHQQRGTNAAAGPSSKDSAVSRITTSKADTRFLRTGTETAQTEAIGVELEYIVERAGGDRTYIRAYSLDAARILAEIRNQDLDTDG